MFKKFAMAAMVVLASMASTAWADDYPSKPITIIVPFPPGSASDSIPRLLVPSLSKTLGQPVVVENRAGANGSIGAARVANSAPDGYTVLLATTGIMAINPWVYDSLAYSPTKDLAPVINGAVTPNLIVVNPGVDASDLKSLVALAKKKPGALSFASGGNGSTSHLCGESLKAATGIDIVHVPYQGPAPALQDVLAGRVEIMCDNLPNVIQHVRQGKLKAIALASTERSGQAPEISTVVEAGYPNVLAGNWYGFLVPAATPRPIVDKLNAALAKALHEPETAQNIESRGLSIIADTPEHFRSVIEKDLDYYRGVVKAANAKIQ